MQNPSEKGSVFQVRALTHNQPTPFALRPTKAELASTASELDLIELRKATLEGKITASGKNDWTLTARLGATVVQLCVVTLAPVTSRIDVDISRHFLAKMPELGEDEEIEMPDDENAELLGAEIDVFAVLFEALALNLPLFPRAEGAELQEVAFTEPGKKAMTDEDARPFASLAALKNKLEASDDE
ncbi:MAG: YceD family protein [Shimia sp.]|jgi:uncharacterized metal-binding protein YceD (DUF177 family)|uniref:YceD family protein n=1 Tax=Shimia sp. TaxID=1954381 RepID=UPI00405A3229